MEKQVNQDFDNKESYGFEETLPYNNVPQAHCNSPPPAYKAIFVGGEESENAFSDESVRRYFIRKVYMLLALQYLIFSVAVAIYAYTGQALPILPPGVAEMMIFVLTIFALVSRFSRRTEVSVILIIAFTVLTIEHMMCDIISERRMTEFETYNLYKINLHATLLILIGIILSTFRTEKFTMKRGFIIVVIIAMIYATFLFVSSSWSYMSGSELIMICVMLPITLIYPIYLVYNTGVILDGKHRYTFTPDEYIFATLTLMVDPIRLIINAIINFFKHICCAPKKKIDTAC